MEEESHKVTLIQENRRPLECSVFLFRSRSRSLITISPTIYFSHTLKKNIYAKIKNDLYLYKINNSLSRESQLTLTPIYRIAREYVWSSGWKWSCGGKMDITLNATPSLVNSISWHLIPETHSESEAICWNMRLHLQQTAFCPVWRGHFLLLS